MKAVSRNSRHKPRKIHWEIGFAALKKFRSREKHCLVPRGHEEGTFKLGIWVNNQRYRARTLSIERKKRLDALQFAWHPYEIGWEKVFRRCNALSLAKNIVECRSDITKAVLGWDAGSRFNEAKEKRWRRALGDG
jgi:hypothetical protein